MDTEEKEKIRRELIIDAALEKFRRYGIRRVTIGEISGALRMSKKTVYRHFDSKEALVTACVNRITSAIYPQMETILEGEGPARAKLLEAFETLSRIPALVSAEFLSDMKADYPHIWEQIDRNRHRIFSRFESLIQNGIASGDLSPAIHSKVLMRMLLAIIEHVVTPDVFSLGEFTPVQVFETLSILVTHGIFVDGDAVPKQEA